MGVYGNSFMLLCDEDGEIDLSKLTKKAAEMEIKMKQRVQEIENQKNIINPPLIPSCHNDEVEGDGWKVHESKRKTDGVGKRGGEATFGLEKKQVKKEGESGELEEEREVYEGLLVEEITKGTQKVKRIVEKRMKKKAADIAIHSKKKKKANAIRKLNGKQSH